MRWFLPVIAVIRKGLVDLALVNDRLQRLPDLQRVIGASRSKALACGRPGHSVDGVGVAEVGEQLLARSFLLDVGAPYLDRLVGAGGGELCAIRRPGHGVDDIRMAHVAENRRSVDPAADLYHLVGAGGSDALAVGRPGHGIDLSGVAAIVEDSIAYIKA